MGGLTVAQPDDVGGTGDNTYYESVEKVLALIVPTIGKNQAARTKKTRSHTQPL